MGHRSSLVSRHARAAPRAGWGLWLAAGNRNIAHVVPGHPAERGGHRRQLTHSDQVWNEEQLAGALEKRLIYPGLVIRPHPGRASPKEWYHLLRQHKPVPAWTP